MDSKILGNRYQLLERIGGGGMAVVYKAKCLLLNRFVAVKILRGEFTDDEEFVKRFRVEAQAAASLNHPNIVSIYDVGKQDDAQYIVMEYIDGITLKEYISKKGALPWKEAVSIAVQICSALEQAHKNHIVHRDIKPHNILITREGIAKVTDFGIARAVTSATITMVGSTIGSVHYFSPEQARGGFTDEKSDLYSLGVTIYEMVTGRVPFDGETPVAVALKHIQERAERPIDINPSIPKGLNDIIMKAMKKDQNLRYQSASDMLNDLQRTLSEPNVQIAGNSSEDYDLPTRKMQALGKDIEMPDEYEGDVTEADDEDSESGPEGKEGAKTGKGKKDKLSVWLGIATGLVVAGILFFIGIKPLLDAIKPDNTDVFIVQNYEGKDFIDVKNELSKYNITAVEDRIHNDTVDQDAIISQSVEVGNKLKPGASIKFTVSDGPELVQVPDVSNKEARVGEQLIQNENLDYNEVQENSDTVATGVIIRTEPAALEEIKPGEAVTVFVSSGPKLEKVKVPNVVGLTRKEAEEKILANGLTIGTIIPSDQISDVAKIIKQYPLAETEVDEQTPVELTFQIDDAAQTGQNGQTGTGDASGNQDGTSAEQPKTHLLKIELDPNLGYGDEVQVYVEATPSDTNELTVVYNKARAKSDFPFNVEVPLAKQGTTHIIVKLDNVVVQEGDV
ncbi:MAG TPA: Stk1 family PASTA domain-containing Ser/Thr kinase [Clostridia bacterium]|nr:Stk1 family PASTA domain-containing Ser/Thr kinase [Clostridia bacterium]